MRRTLLATCIGAALTLGLATTATAAPAQLGMLDVTAQGAGNLLEPAGWNRRRHYGYYGYYGYRPYYRPYYYRPYYSYYSYGSGGCRWSYSRGRWVCPYYW